MLALCSLSCFPSLADYYPQIAMSQLSQLIWDGAINVCFTLWPNDSNQMEQSRKYYCSVNRNSYFPLYYPKILKYLEPYLLVPGWSQSSEWWLEFEEVPLKWNYPIGLLHDVLTGLDPQKRKKNQDYVWNLTLHYRNYPENYLLPLPTFKTLETHWVNQIKESCYVQHGSAKPVMILSKQESSDLWKSIEEHEYTTFWSVMPKIQGKFPKKLKSIPIRLYLPASDKVVDVPVKPLEDDSEEVSSLGQVLKQVLPDFFPSAKNNIIAKPVLHGITIPLDTPLADLFFECLYMDGFLHVSIILMS